MGCVGCRVGVLGRVCSRWWGGGGGGGGGGGREGEPDTAHERGEQPKKTTREERARERLRGAGGEGGGIRLVAQVWLTSAGPLLSREQSRRPRKEANESESRRTMSERSDAGDEDTHEGQRPKRPAAEEDEGGGEAEKEEPGRQHDHEGGLRQDARGEGRDASGRSPRTQPNRTPRRGGGRGEGKGSSKEAKIESTNRVAPEVTRARARIVLFASEKRKALGGGGGSG